MRNAFARSTIAARRPKKAPMRGKITIGAILAAAGAAASAAAEPSICADRPGKSSQACTVPAGHFQFESSLADWTLQEGGGERDTALVIGETDFKYGLTDRSHIDVDIQPWQRQTSEAGSGHDSASGFGDVVVKYKHRLTAADSALQVALSPFVKIPSAKRPIGNGKWEGGFVLPIQYADPRSPIVISLTPEVDWSADSDGAGHHATMVQVANIGWQVTSRLNLSGEIWGQWEWDPQGTTKQVSADGALAYLANNDLQLDAGANIGLNRATPDVEIYLGIAKQF